MKAHHALADGVSFAETFANLFDISPEVRPPGERVDEVEDELDGHDVARTARRGTASLAPAIRRLIIENVASWGSRVLRDRARRASRRALVRGRRHATPDQPSIFEARRTSLNGSAGIEKTFLRARVPLAEAKRAAKAHGATVTDFVMASTSGALQAGCSTIAERS